MVLKVMIVVSVVFLLLFGIGSCVEPEPVPTPIIDGAVDGPIVFPERMAWLSQQPTGAVLGEADAWMAWALGWVSANESLNQTNITA